MPTTPIHTVGGFTIDAIIHADGTWTTKQLGGNALWAAMGVNLGTDGAPVSHAIVGSDYPVDALERIAEKGVDVSDVERKLDRPNARVTFAYKADGSRTQPAPPEAVALLPESVHPEFADSTRDPSRTLASLVDGDTVRKAAQTVGGSWHLGLLPGARFAELVDGLREGGADYIQADCPARFELARDGETVLAEHLGKLDVFLPSTSDTDVFAPGVDHQSLIKRFHAYGAPIVILKRGADGVIVSDSQSGQAWSVPAIPAPEGVDATGAGDVFCGHFAHVYRNGGDLLEAAIQASVAAQSALYTASPLSLTRADQQEWEAAVATIRTGVEEL